MLGAAKGGRLEEKKEPTAGHEGVQVCLNSKSSFRGIGSMCAVLSVDDQRAKEILRAASNEPLDKGKSLLFLHAMMRLGIVERSEARVSAGS